MKKISCVLAALATIAVAAPTVASAEGFSFRVGSDRDYYRDRDNYRGARVREWPLDRGHSFRDVGAAMDRALCRASEGGSRLP